MLSTPENLLCMTFYSAAVAKIIYIDFSSRFFYLSSLSVIVRNPVPEQRDKVNFNMAFIPTEIEKKSNKELDTDYMQELFDYRYKHMIDGYSWKQTLPEFE